MQCALHLAAFGTLLSRLVMTTTMMMMMIADSSQTKTWEGRGWGLACLLMVVEPISWCAHPTALWTGEGLGLEWFTLLHFGQPKAWAEDDLPYCSLDSRRFGLRTIYPTALWTAEGLGGGWFTLLHFWAAEGLGWGRFTLLHFWAAEGSGWGRFTLLHFGQAKA